MDTLPEELLEHIFRSVSVSGTKDLRLVCRAWDRVIMEGGLIFREVDLRKRKKKIDFGSFADTHKFHVVEAVRLPVLEVKGIERLFELTTLRELSLFNTGHSHSEKDITLFTPLLREMRALEILRLVNFDDGNWLQLLSSLPLSCPNLVVLDLSVQDSFPARNSHALPVDTDYDAEMLCGLTELRELDLTGRRIGGRAVIRFVETFGAQLRYLGIGEVSRDAPERAAMLQAVGTYCTELRHLGLDSAIGLGAMRLSELETAVAGAAHTLRTLVLGGFYSVPVTWLVDSLLPRLTRLRTVYLGDSPRRTAMNMSGFSYDEASHAYRLRVTAPHLRHVFCSVRTEVPDPGDAVPVGPDGPQIVIGPQAQFPRERWREYAFSTLEKVERWRSGKKKPSL